MTITYSDLQTRITDELNRSDLSNQIDKAIIRAIKHYQKQRFWFTETSTTLTAVASQAYVDVPIAMVYWDKLEITVSGINIPLRETDHHEVFSYRRTVDSQPTMFAYYQDRFEFDCPALTTYSLPLKYTTVLTELSDPTDTNAWTEQAEDLVVGRAKADVQINVLRDSIALQDYNATVQRPGGFLCGFERAAYMNLARIRDLKAMTGYTVSCD